MEISGSLEYCINIVLFPEDIRYVKGGKREVPQVKHKSDGCLAWFISFTESLLHINLIPSMELLAFKCGRGYYRG